MKSEKHYKFSKQALFGLFPTEATKAVLKDYTDNGLALNEDIVKVKKILDDFFKGYIRRRLEVAKEPANWQSEHSFLSSDVNERKAAFKEISQMIQGILKDDPDYKMIAPTTPSALMKQIAATSTDASVVALMNIQATYLSDFMKNRQTLFGYKTNSVADRVVNNLMLFSDNNARLAKVKDTFPQAVADANNELNSYGFSIDVENVLSNYRDITTSEGIAKYNLALSGCTIIRDNEKIVVRGLNNFINSNLTKGTKRDDFILKRLNKVILVDDPTVSFIPSNFATADEMFRTIEAYAERAKELDIEKTLGGIIDDIILDDNGMDKAQILINKNNLNKISHFMFGKWDILETLLNEKASTFKTAKERKSFLKPETISLQMINELIDTYNEQENTSKDPYVFWREIPRAEMYVEFVAKAAKALEPFYAKDVDMAKTATRRENGITVLKTALDQLLEASGKFNILTGRNKKGITNTAFEEYQEIIDFLDKGQKLHNSIRSFITRKIGDVRKERLYFGFPSFGEGWSQGTDFGNTGKKGCLLMRRNGRYLLAVPVKVRAKELNLLDGDKTNSRLEMLRYYSMKSMKMLPLVMFSNANRETMEPLGIDADFEKRYREKEHKNNPSFLLELIDKSIKALNTYPGWTSIKWNLGKAEDYTSWNEFTDKVDEQGEICNFEYVNETAFDKWESEGRMLVFEITSDYLRKVYAGKPSRDKLTDYFLAAVNGGYVPGTNHEGVGRCRLLGFASVYYRKKVINRPIVHRKGSILVNKIMTNGLPVPPDQYREIYLALNGHKPMDDISAEAKHLLAKGLVVHKQARYDIIKDRRLTDDTFMFHVPVSINDDAELSLDDRNGIMADLNVEAKEMYGKYGNVIVVTRGLSHLISCALFTKDGIEKWNYDTIKVQSKVQLANNEWAGADKECNFREKFRQMDQLSKEQRQSWAQVDKVADIQRGFLHNVIRDILVKAVDNNAILVLEDMSFSAGEKCIRSILDAKIYRTFEGELLTAASTFAPDKNASCKISHLTAGKGTISENRGQNGIVLFVNPAKVQKMDPTTGFVSLFRLGDYNKLEKRHALFQKMNIKVTEDDVLLSFKYSELGIDNPGRDEWTISCNVTKPVREKDKYNNVTVKDTNVARMMLDTYEHSKAIANGDSFEVFLRESMDYAESDIMMKALGMVLNPIVYGKDTDDFVSPVIVNGKKYIGSRYKDCCDDAMTRNLYSRAIYELSDNEKKSTEDWLAIVQG